ncbi:hypothetical protein [Elstera sp.]|uniref:hypothetical protein n=1 Tax=Elstera sp. TaxID=1916664 RepID=UPI0037C14245
MKNLTVLTGIIVSRKTLILSIQLYLALIFAIFSTIEFQGITINGLDYSWIFSLNHFFKENYQHGIDIIFNFGPLGFLFSSAYYPESQNLKYTLSIMYHIILFYSVFYVFNINNASKFLSMSILIMSMEFFYSANILLPAILISYHEVYRENKALSTYVITIFLSLLLAVASLVKSAILILALPILVLVTLYRLSIKDYYPVALGAYCLFTALILSLGGQDGANWADFYRGYFDVSLSYNADMGLPAPPLYLALWCVGALSVLSCFPLKSRKTIILALTILGCLLVAYKLSFTRHGDYSYLAFWALAFIATAQILNPLARFYGLAHRALILGTAGLALVVALAIAAPFQPAGKGLQDTLTILHDRLKFFGDSDFRNQRRLDNRQEFTAAMADLRQKFPFKAVAGPIDAFPFDIGLAYSAGLDLATRPAFQAYYATSRFMTERNRDFLATDRAARSILFSIAPIDGRFAALEDPLSLRAFRSFYRVDQQTAEHLVLVRRAKPLLEAETCQDSVSRFDTAIPIPAVLPDQAVWARVLLTPTVVGRVAAFFFGGPTLGLTVSTTAAPDQAFRFLRDAGDVGFLLSPGLTSLEAAAAFYRGESRAQDAVTQIRVSNRTGDTILRWFEPAITVSLCTLSWSSPAP